MKKPKTVAEMVGMQVSFGPPRQRLYSMEEVLTEAVAVFFRLTGAGVSELATFQETLRRALESPPSGRWT